MPKRLLSDDERFALLKRNRWNCHEAAKEARVNPRTAAYWASELKTKGYDVGTYEQDRPDVPMAGPTKPKAETLPLETIKAMIRKSPHSLDQIADELGISRGQALDAVDQLRDLGLNIHEHSGEFSWAKQPTPGHVRSDLPALVTDADGWLRFGVTSDNHLCSKYSRLDVLNVLYDRFAEAGVSVALNAGNWIDGEAIFNKHDLLVHGMNAQLEYLANNFPQRPGITTYAISGDDHEGWYAQRAGVDIGRMAQQKMQDHGRDDWIDVGYMEAFLNMQHAGSGASSRLHLIHAGGGTAYAESYTVQKIVESYDPGEKPAVLIAGHYHKSIYARIRNVATLQPGCTQDQTPFMRKKKIRATVAGWIIELKLSAETGGLEVVKLQEFVFPVRNQVNNRWSHSGDVEFADRGTDL